MPARPVSRRSAGAGYDPDQRRHRAGAGRRRSVTSRANQQAGTRKPPMPDTHSADALVFPVKPEIAAHAHVTAEGYRTMYEHATRDPDGFWAEQAKRIAWIKPPTKIKNTTFAGHVSIKWF